MKIFAAKRSLAWILVPAVLALSVTAALAFDLGSLLKVAGVGVIVSQYGGSMDKAINSALKEHHAEALGATKVVPIFSVGRGLFVGAAQVVGVPENVRTVQAVAQVEAKFGSLGGTLMIPISTKKPLGGGQPKAVPNVGLSAVIDIKV
jgi:hypothetical protein